MKAHTTNPLHSVYLSDTHPTRIVPATRLSHTTRSLKRWITAREPVWEYNRLGIAATGIFIQVTFAAGMILILGATGASPFLYGTGIFLAFIADSLAFAQAPMRWVLGTFLASIIVNLSLMLYYCFFLL